MRNQRWDKSPKLKYSRAYTAVAAEANQFMVPTGMALTQAIFPIYRYRISSKSPKKGSRTRRHRVVNPGTSGISSSGRGM